jgi:hypothetical protein
MTCWAVFFADANVRFHAEIVLIALLSRMHFRVALALFILRRARRMNDRGVDDSAVTQQQATVTQIATDDAQNSGGQGEFLQQAAEFEESGFIGMRSRLRPAKCRKMVVSYSDSSIVGSL